MNEARSLSHSICQLWELLDDWGQKREKDEKYHLFPSTVIAHIKYFRTRVFFWAVDERETSFHADIIWVITFVQWGNTCPFFPIAISMQLFFVDFMRGSSLVRRAWKNERHLSTVTRKSYLFASADQGNCSHFSLYYEFHDNCFNREPFCSPRHIFHAHLIRYNIQGSVLLPAFISGEQRHWPHNVEIQAIKQQLLHHWGKASTYK